MDTLVEVSRPIDNDVIHEYSNLVVIGVALMRITVA